MSTIAIQSHFLLEKLRSLSFQIGAFFGGTGSFDRKNRAEHIRKILFVAKQEQIFPTFLPMILHDEDATIHLDSAGFYEILRCARNYYEQMVMDSIALEDRMPRASYMILIRRVLDIEASWTYQKDYVQIAISCTLDKEKYPMRLQYFMNQSEERNASMLHLNQWLQLFGYSVNTAFGDNGDLVEECKKAIRGRMLCFLKYFHDYHAQDANKPVFWTYNRVHYDKEMLLQSFIQDVDGGIVSSYHPEKYKRETFPTLQTFLQDHPKVNKLFFQRSNKGAKNTFVLQSGISDRDIFISLQQGKQERVQGILNSKGLSLLSNRYFWEISELLRELDIDPASVIMNIGTQTGICSVCGRKLSKHGSVHQGVGPVCALKLQVTHQGQQNLFR